MQSSRLQQLDWTAAVEAEIAARSSLLPSRVLEVSLRGYEDETAELIRGHHVSGAAVYPAEVVVAAKSSRGFRPVATPSFADRVLLRALVDALEPPLGEPDRSSDAWARFNQIPLEIEGTSHVARADVAAFYQYIDHDLLRRELVGRTGDAELADQITSTLEGILGRRVGLPQSNETSHVLADAYLDVVERKLLRRGHAVWRYNDDFHFAAPDLRTARRGLEDLEIALRSVGLSPNDEKSMILTRENFATWVDAPAQRREEISDELEVELETWILLPSTEYSDPEATEVVTEVDVADGPDDETQIMGAVRALELWWEYITTNDPLDPLELYINRGLARDGIRLLRRRRSEAGLRLCSHLVTFEPQLTHTVCRYLRSLAANGSDQPQVFVHELVSSGSHLSYWQQLWLLEPLWKSTTLSPELLRWLDALTLSSEAPDALRARAAFVLGVHHSIGFPALGTLFDSVLPASRPDVVAAAAALSDDPDDPRLTAITRESPLLAHVSAFVLNRYGNS